MFDELTNDSLKDILDMNRREVLVFAPLIIATIWFGVYPMPLLDVTEVSVENLIQNYQQAIAAFEAGAADLAVAAEPQLGDAQL